MCPLGKVISCEISFIPVQSSDYIADVDKVLDVIRASGLEHSVEPFSTVVRGEFEKVIELVRDIYRECLEFCVNGNRSKLLSYVMLASKKTAPIEYVVYFLCFHNN